MKKFLSLLLCLILLFGLLPMTAPARADSSGDWEYEIDGGKATITKYNGAGGEVTIPSTLGGATVTVIGNYVFSGCTDLTAVTIPKSITKMEYGAFSGCDGLEQVKISDLKAWCAIEFLDYSANPLYYSHVLYLNGRAVTKLTIPSGVTNISDYAFYGCSTLKSAVIPEGVESIGNRAFSDCSGLTNVTIPSTVTSIGTGAFYGCKSLSSAAIPSGVTDIGDYAFYNCSGLTSVTIPEGVTDIGDYAFYNCSGLTSVTIPEGVTAIGDYAFCNCSNLPGVVIPEGVTGIGNDAFSGCYRLISVSIPKSVVSIGVRAFYGCSMLTSIKIPSGVKNIGDGAFGECGLISVTIPKSVKTMGSYVFQSMEGYLITAGPTGSGCDIQYGWTTSIPKNAFSNCFYLQVAVIPDTVTEIRENAFSCCSDLQQVYFGGTAEQWEEVLLFGGNEALQRAKLYFGYQTGDPIIIDSGSCGANLTWTLDNNGKLTISGTGRMTAFTYSAPERIRSVVLNNGVTSIGEYAFSGCSSLISVTIPESVTDIGTGAFNNCPSLKNINIPENITVIQCEVFNGCSNLTNIIIPSNVTNIGQGAFIGCAGLTSVTIPKSVVGIDWDVFKDCFNLADVYYGGSKEDWANIVIDSYGNELLLNATIHFTEPLTITGLKANKTGAAPGTAITWTATASGGSGTLKYYFILYKDGTQIATRSYSKTKTFSYTPTEAGTYKVKVYVKDEDGTKVHKTGAAVTIAVPPVITAQPSPKTVTSGKTAVFTVTASGTGLTYQWQYSKDGGTTWYNKSGATSASCSVTAKTSYNGFLYRCKVSNAGGTVYSNSAKLTVTAAKPVITTQPANQTVAAGETATFKVAASGTGLTYQWQYSKDGGTTWYNKTDANSTTYTVTAKASYDGFLYRCKVKNSAGAVYSNSAKLTVTSSAAPVISSVKANKTTAAAGTKITWTATASGGTGTLQYYFIVYKDGTKVKTRSYSTTNTFSYTPTEAGIYKVRVYVKDAADNKVNKLSGAVTVTDPAVISSAEDYGLLLFTYMRENAGTFGEDLYYAQVILGTGQIMNSMPISQTTYASGLATNTVYKLSQYDSTYLLTAAKSSECSIETYNASDPFTDYSSANYIWHNGKTAADLTVTLNKNKPKAGSNVIIVYTTEQAGASIVRKVKAVWFQTAS